MKAIGSVFLGLLFLDVSGAWAQLAEAPKPGPEHARLGFFVGQWRAEGEMKASPRGPGGKMSMKDRCEWFEGKFAVVCHGEGTTPMGPKKGLGIMSYSPEHRAYVYYGIDSRGMVMGTVPKGIVDGDTWTYLDESSMGGVPVKSRYVLKQVSPKSYTGNEMERRNKLTSCGGVPYLSHLVSTVPTSLDIDSYAQIVKNLSISRQLIILGNQCVEIGRKADPDNGKNIGQIYFLITDFKKKNMPLKGLITPKESSDILFELLDKYNEPSHAIGWGYRVLDEITSGIYPSELTVIGARPSVGKTQLMLDIAENVARQGKIILFCSVEMAIKALMERRVARELSLSVLDLRKRGLTQLQQDKLVELVGKNSEHSIYYLADGTSSQEAMCRRLFRGIRSVP